MQDKPEIPSARNMVRLHDELLVKWKKDGDCRAKTRGLPGWIEENHLRNIRLWQAEDKARREDKGFEYVYRAKRAIDTFNQQRNDFIEKMDAWLVQALNPPQTGCAFNSETPGMMIDRLSILADYQFTKNSTNETAEIFDFLKYINNVASLTVQASY